MKSVTKSTAGESAAVAKVACDLFAPADLAPDQEAGKNVACARAFAQPLIGARTLESGENTFAHAEAVADILQSVGGSQALQASSYLVYVWEHLNQPHEVIASSFGSGFANLALETNRLIQVQRQAAAADLQARLNPGANRQAENIRKMLLAFSRDLRVVMLRLASRLQTLRYHAASKKVMPQALAAETLDVFAPLANRLGIWQIKWEMEDLAFRFLEPDRYQDIARQLDENRASRESAIETLRQRLSTELGGRGITADVQGRPKHIYSIDRKMRGKRLSFDQVLDIRAFRVIVGSPGECYAALSYLQEIFVPIAGEFDDYIARPKPNGYQSLHTVVRDGNGKPMEIQIRTQAMHQHAETGLSAHWAYKEAGIKGYAGVSASAPYDAKIAVLRQLLAWKQEVCTGASGQVVSTMGLDDRVYVLTPEAAIIDLPQGATPVDFAYAVHTSLGHRCRGARVDGQMVPLNTALVSGQSVEIQASKTGGPSRDWLNGDLRYLVSARAKAKVRAWFNAVALDETIARGRDAVEKTLQREGKTAIKLEDLAAQLGYKSAERLFELVGKDELSVRTVEQFLRAKPAPAQSPQERSLELALRSVNPSAPNKLDSSVLVVGVGSLLTQLAKCCKPLPPDAIQGYVTRGRGVSVHRLRCPTLQKLVDKEGERLVDVQWGAQMAGWAYAADIRIISQERLGLVRDIADVFIKNKIPVRAMAQTQLPGGSCVTLTVEVADGPVLLRALALASQVQGVQSAKRL